MNKVLLIGCGHMGSALLDACINLKSYSFTVVDPFNIKFLKKKYRKYNIDILSEGPSQIAIKKFDIIIFAIKPQVCQKVIVKYINYNFKNNSLICSIVAGKKINFFKKNLIKSKQIVRVMPNMPALIGKGISCMVSSKNLSMKNKNIINKLFSEVGKTIWLKNEKQIDMATAISGSGPGYIFTLIDAFEKAAKKIGFSNQISRELILATILGSVKLMEYTNKEPKDLANSIAVKGGTTEAAVKVLLKKNIDNTMYSAVSAAYKKASKLGKDK